MQTSDKEFLILLLEILSSGMARVYNIHKTYSNKRNFHTHELTRKEQRYDAFKQMALLKEIHPFKGLEDYEMLQLAYLVFSIGSFNISLGTKYAVQFNLYVKTLLTLGTEKHRNYAKAAIELRGKIFTLLHL